MKILEKYHRSFTKPFRFGRKRIFYLFLQKFPDVYMPLIVLDLGVYIFFFRFRYCLFNEGQGIELYLPAIINLRICFHGQFAEWTRGRLELYLLTIPIVTPAITRKKPNIHERLTRARRQQRERKIFKA